MKRLAVAFLLALAARLAAAQTAPVECTLNANDAIAQVFGVPATEVLAQAFGLGLTAPLTGYLVAYCVGLLINFWNK
ncbi:MAG: hypothetical protein H6R10_596 [Rhodocyclaceae bacterium]|nr:hypothetical protein [Rhodocyclaceae bacterium]